GNHGRRQLENIFLFRLRLNSRAQLPELPRNRAPAKSVPGTKIAFFSILKPHAHIPEHCGADKGSIESCWFLTKSLVTCRVLAKMAAPIWTVAAATNWP